MKHTTRANDTARKRIVMSTLIFTAMACLKDEHPKPLTVPGRFDGYYYPVDISVTVPRAWLTGPLALLHEIGLATLSHERHQAILTPAGIALTECGILETYVRYVEALDIIREQKTDGRTGLNQFELSIAPKKIIALAGLWKLKKIGTTAATKTNIAAVLRLPRENICSLDSLERDGLVTTDSMNSGTEKRYE